MLFALDGARWNEERVLERYELLYEAGLAPEAARDRDRAQGGAPAEPVALAPALGEPMISDHRRILATGLGRLRGKLKYRPIVFELMGEAFTLSALQRTVEAIAGVPLHKQNFRRVGGAGPPWSRAWGAWTPTPGGGRPNCSASAASCSPPAPPRALSLPLMLRE